MHKSGRAIKHHEIYLLDARTLCRFLADLTIYDYVPSLEPLKDDILRLTAKITRIRETMRAPLHDKVREDYERIINRFHELFSYRDVENLRRFLLERKWIDAKAVIFSDSPY